MKPMATKVRVFPMPVFADHPQNWCRWCGLEIVHGRANQRSWHDGRLDESSCTIQRDLHIHRDTQFAHVANRDGKKCFDCEGAPERWIKDHWLTYVWMDREKENWPPGEPAPHYIGIRRTTALELEHTVPLWKVAHLPPESRRKFFHVENLRLRCQDCHSAKTAKEAGDRAHTERLRKAQSGEIKVKRPIPSRSFQAPTEKKPWPKRPFPKRTR